MSPDDYLHRVEHGAGVYVPMDRAAYHRSIFLDQRIQPARRAEGRGPLPPVPIQPSAYIFHIAHCGSTLLSRALDRIDGNLVLREPLALRQAALDPSIPLAPVLGLLSRRYRAELPTLIKANVPVNFILDRIIDAVPDMRALFLHMPLESWLTAVMRSANHRAWVRDVSAAIGLPVQANEAKTTAQLWLAQTDAFRAAMARVPQSVSLNADRFFADPVPLLLASGAALGVPMSEEEAAETVAGPIFTHDSKRPESAFGNAEREMRAEQTRAAIADEIAVARNWIEARGGDTSPLPRAL